MSTTSQHDFPEVQPHTHTVHTLYERLDQNRQILTCTNTDKHTEETNRHTATHPHTLYMRGWTDTHLHKYRHTQHRLKCRHRHSTDTDRQNLKKHPNVCFLTFNFYPLCHQFSMITFSDLLNPNEISPIPTQLVLSTRVFNHSSPFHLRP